ncbi:uncharacterized protein FTOL_08154 [Fusarium torulosum]|uniref:Uncharacterized protein n=1 Tax=Fusarium torulosum TaxID=33205 RepID=A0AAE8SJP6_9HYPO|nr:uncharacterized protein FTOL_08154 [Fusarium torulosum]
MTSDYNNAHLHQANLPMELSTLPQSDWSGSLLERAKTPATKAILYYSILVTTLLPLYNRNTSTTAESCIDTGEVKILDTVIVRKEMKLIGSSTICIAAEAQHDDDSSVVGKDVTSVGDPSLVRTTKDAAKRAADVFFNGGTRGK